MSPHQPAENAVTRDHVPVPRGSGGPPGQPPRCLTITRAAQADLKWYLLNKYRALFVDKLSREDLEELQHYLGLLYDPECGWNRQYVPEIRPEVT